MVSSNTLLLYKKAVEEGNSLDGLNGFYDWIKEAYNSAFNDLYLTDYSMKTAVEQSVISQRDREFFMDELMLNKEHDFIGLSGEILTNISEKIKEMYVVKGKYDELMLDKFVQNKKELELKNKKSFDLLNIESYLKLSINDREDYIKNLEISLSEAKKFEIDNMIINKEIAHKEYEKLIKEAQIQKTIGDLVATNMFKVFNKENLEDQKSIIKDFELSLIPYENLWKDIKDSLDNNGFSELISQLNFLDYGGLSKQFNKHKKVLSKKLDYEYTKLLKEKLDNRTISKKDYDNLINIKRIK